MRRLLAGVDLHPCDLPFAAVGLGHRRIDHPAHHRGDVEAGAVALDEGNDRLVGDVQGVVGVDRYFFPFVWDVDASLHGFIPFSRLYSVYHF
ncbi:MAG: hypothetical protein MPW15_14965 [Candidatus Manganitrophus sp.]|nr:hypothetical protein [Candidatus Manganitrophus sp.]